MPFGTACHRLRKLVLFDLLKKYDDNVCLKCGKIIESVDDLSMEHKEPWLDVDPSLFWDLANIAFSHIKCNTRDRTGRKQGSNGTAWCYKCKKFLPINMFGKDKHQWDSLNKRCLVHDREQAIEVKRKRCEHEN